MVQVISGELRNLLKNGSCQIKTPEDNPEIITHFYLDGDMVVFVNESISDSQTGLLEQHHVKVATFSSNILKQFNRFKWITIISFSLLGWLPVLFKGISIYETLISVLFTSGLFVVLRKLIMNFVINILSIRFSDKAKGVFKLFRKMD